MKVILTSFTDSVNWSGEMFSIVRWQPKGFDYRAMSFLAPWDPDSHRKMVQLEPDCVFREMYDRLLIRNRFEIRMAMRHDRHEQIALCCQCHPDRQKGYETV